MSINQKRYISVFTCIIVSLIFFISGCGGEKKTQAIPPAPTPSLDPIQEVFETAEQAGWLSGYTDGALDPDAYITRAEFVKLLCTATRMTPDSDLGQWLTGVSQRYFYDWYPYDDYWDIYLPDDLKVHWLTKEGWSTVAMKFGFIATNLDFHPDDSIKKMDVIIMSIRAMGLIYSATSNGTVSLPAAESGYIKQAVEAGLIEDGDFNADEYMTWTETVFIISRLLNCMEADINTNVKWMMSYIGVDPYPIDTSIPAIRQGDVLYFPIRLFYSEYERKVLGGYSSIRDIGYTSWDSEKQTLHVLWSEYGGSGRYSAGNAGVYYDDNDIVKKPNKCTLLYGEIMVPLDLNDLTEDASFHYYLNLRIDIMWDGDTNILTCNIRSPVYYNGS